MQNRCGCEGRVPCPWYNFQSICVKGEENWRKEKQDVRPLSAQGNVVPGKVVDDQCLNCKRLPYSSRDCSEVHETESSSEMADPAIVQKHTTNELSKEESQLKLAEISESIRKHEDATQGESQLIGKSPIHFGRKVDALNPYNHQRIAVLFSSYSSESNNSPRPCISPW